MELVRILQAIKPVVHVATSIPWEDMRRRDRRDDWPSLSPPTSVAPPVSATPAAGSETPAAGAPSPTPDVETRARELAAMEQAGHISREHAVGELRDLMRASEQASGGGDSEEEGGGCSPCTVFRRVAHARSLLAGVARACDPDGGLAEGTGGTIPLAHRELSDAAEEMQRGEGFEDAIEAVHEILPRLQHVGGCDEAQEVAEAATAAEATTHEAVRRHFAARKGVA